MTTSPINMLILYTDGTYKVTVVKSFDEYTELLKCRFLTSLPTVSTKFRQNAITDVWGYVDDEGMLNHSPWNEWSFFLDALCLYSKDDQGFIHGNVLLTGRDQDGDGEDHSIPLYFIDLVKNYSESKNKEEARISLSLIYHELKKCTLRECTNKGNKLCTRCEDVAYCSKECQTKDKVNHKPNCKTISQKTDDCKQQ